MQSKRGDVICRWPSVVISWIVLLFSANLSLAEDRLPTKYPDHHDLSYYIDQQGQRQPVRNIADWAIRQRHILENLQQVMGPLPSAASRVPLEVKLVEEIRIGEVIRRKVTFQSDPTDRVPAYLLLPLTVVKALDAGQSPPRRPAVLCLQQTTNVGKDEPAGVRGDASLPYALELARRGFVTIAPDYPSFGEHHYDFALRHGYVSGSMKAVWDNVRAIDFLQSLDFVQTERIGCIGHSLGGHNGIFTAVFDRRIKAVVTSCGFSSMTRDDVPSWNGPRYMPRIASVYKNDVQLLPFDFHELIGALAPRALFVCAATRDDDFDVQGVREVLAAARTIYSLHNQAERLVSAYPDAPHSFPQPEREAAYQFLAKQLENEAN